MDREEWIRRRAYNLWCAEGWPKGRDKEHWEQASKEAEREIELAVASGNFFDNTTPPRELEIVVPDDKSKRGGADRRRVAAGQPYEVAYFARKHGISRDQARKIIERCGSDRERANREAERIA